MSSIGITACSSQQASFSIAASGSAATDPSIATIATKPTPRR